MQKKKKIVRGIVIAVLIICAIIYINPILRYRNYQLRNAIQSAEYQDKDTLEKIIPFEWDAVYRFTPYMTNEDMEEEMGFKSRYVSEIKRDDIVQLFVVKDKEVIAYLRETVQPEYSDFVSQIPEEVKYGSNQKMDVIS